MEIVLNIFIVLYLLFCLFWSHNLNIKFIYWLVIRLGLDHSWPMFVIPVLYNYQIHCRVHFKDGSENTFEFSNTKSNSLIHRKYIDSLIIEDYLHGALSDYIINFSGIKNVERVSVVTSKTAIKDYNKAWKDYREELEEDYD